MAEATVEEQLEELRQLDEQFKSNPNSVTPQGKQYRTQLVKSIQNTKASIGLSGAASKLYKSIFPSENGITDFLNTDNPLLQDTFKYWDEKNLLPGGLGNQGNGLNFELKIPEGLDFDQQFQLGAQSAEGLKNQGLNAAQLSANQSQKSLDAILANQAKGLAFDENAGFFSKAFGYTNPITGVTYEGFVDKGLDVVSDITGILFAEDELEETKRSNRENERLGEQQVAAGIITGAQAIGAQEAYRARQIGGNTEQILTARTGGEERFKSGFESLGNKFVDTATV